MSSNVLPPGQDLVYARWVEEELRRESSEVSEEDHSLVTRSRPSTHLQHSRIHPTFRLWITTRADGQRIIPGQCPRDGFSPQRLTWLGDWGDPEKGHGG